ncbi:MFS transporter [Micromonospora haikouensis]|uniref:MFS transporter n=1 Tax=Micromonospora haikouensis TaxID=686309 RepID=UPI003D70EC7C
MTTSRTVTSKPIAAPAAGNKLPWSPLLALSTAAFMGILTEALPAGVLPEMARDLSVSESAAGQMLTIYAIATGVSAIPLIAATSAWGRKQLLLVAVATFAIANVVTATSSSYTLIMAFRLLAGIAAAAVWAELVGYARRLAPAHLQGRAISVTMAGVPLALALGIPVGTFLGGLFGWRLTFGLVAAISGLLLFWIGLSVPAAPGQKAGQREPILQALRLPGVVAVLFTVAAYVLAHNVLYTYISTFLDEYDMGGRRDVILLVFGIASVVSILVTGALVDRKLRTLTIGSAALFVIAAVLLAVAARSDLVVFASMILWGLGWGGVTTLLQTAVTDAGGDRGQALLVTTWNSFMAGGGAVGGILLAVLGPTSFPFGVLALMIPVLLVVVLARRHAFPAQRPNLS